MIRKDYGFDSAIFHKTEEPYLWVFFWFHGSWTCQYSRGKNSYYLRIKSEQF